MCLTVEQYWRFALLICVMKIIFCIGDGSWHFLSNGEVESIAFDDLRFLNRFTIAWHTNITDLPTALDVYSSCKKYGKAQKETNLVEHILLPLTM